MDQCEDDFRPVDKAGPVVGDDDEMVGRRVILQNLKARPELNGKVGRCGPWQPNSGRYAVLVEDQTKFEKFNKLSLKPENLRYSPPLPISPEQLDRLGESRVRPCIRVMWLKAPEEDGNVGSVTDLYHGPLSHHATALVRFFGNARVDQILLMKGSESLPISLRPFKIDMKLTRAVAWCDKGP